MSKSDDTSSLRRVDDPSNAEPTLLQLPITDFPLVGANSSHGDGDTDDGDDSTDGLVLVQLAPEGSNGGLTMQDLISPGNKSKSVYILGNTSVNDVIYSSREDGTGAFYSGSYGTTAVNGNDAEELDGEVGNGGTGRDVSNSFTPIAARLIVEKVEQTDCGSGENETLYKGGKTLELMKVETSNTYIVVPPMKTTDSKTANVLAEAEGEGEQSCTKRQKRSHVPESRRTSSSECDKNENQSPEPPTALVNMPARSIGLVPGENSPSCFFLEPVHLPSGHFAKKLRGALKRWVFDPLDPPSLESGREESELNSEQTGMKSASTTLPLLFGYTVEELAYICRTSQGEIQHAVKNRVFGAEDALLIPHDGGNHASSSKNRRYGMLSEEGKQTVSMAIVAALLESDLKLAWKFDEDEEGSCSGTETSALMAEIRMQWYQLEAEEEFLTCRLSDRNDAQHRESLPSGLSAAASHPSSSERHSQSQSQFFTPSQSLPRRGFSSSSAEKKLGNEIIWHCLRPIIHHESQQTHCDMDTVPPTIRFSPDQVAKLAIHNVFLRGTPKSLIKSNIDAGDGGNTATPLAVGAGCTTWWEEEELVEAWSSRIPYMGRKYEPRLELLRGIAISEARKEFVSKDGRKSYDDSSNSQAKKRRWQYFPEEGLSLDPSVRIKSMLAMKNAWTMKEAAPYLEKFAAGKGDGGVELLMATHAKAVTVMEKGEDGKNVSVTKYVALPK
ncbi:hypothetical protein ACHAXS_010086 [Conticribra weissflogii]